MKGANDRIKQPLSTFLLALEKPKGLVYEWSLARAATWTVNNRTIPNVNVKKFAHTTTIGNTELWNAKQFGIKNKYVCRLPLDDEYIYMMPGKEGTIINKQDCLDYSSSDHRRAITDFDQLIAETTRFYCIQIDESNWKNSFCSCVHAMKNNNCNHIIVVAAKLSKF
jgi:hypothetical protein